ncbi:MAG: thiamine pyrophosphate-binding protein, partial [Candidatus Hydrogenedentes bacterium]|nr:thiamine pyrophosphate-binding protein [Candidatus Hydrogenedentota bacterium]
PRCDVPPPKRPHYEPDLRGRTMIPAFARPAHRRLREKLAQIASWAEQAPVNRRIDGDPALGIITSGVTFVHAREAAPDASFLKLGMSHPLPMGAIRAFAGSVERCVVIEEGEACLADAIRAAGIAVDAKRDRFRFGELTADRVRRILADDCSPEPELPPGKPPRLCSDCSHRPVFQALSHLGCVVSGDIGCYTLAVLPPYEAIHSCVCMGASIGVGLGLRHVLPPEEARRVVSVIGDSTFIHSGITGLVEMVYNPPETGHVVLILDNGTTAMTGAQEHPGTGRTLDHERTNQVVYEDLCRAIGIRNVHVIDPTQSVTQLENLIRESLEQNELTVIITRSPCAIMARRKRTNKSKQRR